MKEVIEYTVFISCPGDVAEDREVIENVIKQYSEKHCSDKIQLKVVHSGTVPSKMGKPAQEHINEKISDYDLYIGLMGARFGSPTIQFGSGTEEEFNIAIKQNEENDSLYVSFLFKEVTFTNPSTDAMEQYTKVRDFQVSIQDKGYYRPYKNNEGLENEVTNILADFLSEQEDEKQNPQYSLLTEVPSQDLFAINEDYFHDFLNSLDANISNGYKEKITLNDVYVPLDVAVLGSFDDDYEDKTEEIISSSLIEKYNNQATTNFFLIGDESSGKTAFCRRAFLNFHRNGIIPIIIDGSQIKASSQENLNRLIDKTFSQQYKTDALVSYNALDKHKKLIILDNIDDSTLNKKHKLSIIKKMESIFGHVIITSDQFFLFNASLMEPEEYSKFNHYRKYEIQHIGHKLRDDLTRKWLVAGREHILEDDELYKLADKYGRTIEAVLGSNYVPRRPFVILVLLQGIHCGTESSDLTHSSFVRYYQFLIDETLLKRVPKEKIDLYYAFLPEIAYLIFQHNTQSFTKDQFNALIKEYAERKDIDSHHLVNLKSHLITLGMLVFDDENEAYRFKHNYTYFYFLGQYFEENMSRPKVSAQVVDICNKIHIRENANIVIFLSYHTRDTLIIGTLLDKAETLFSDEEVFDFGKENTSKLNQLVTQAPKIILQHGKEKSERDESLRNRDKAEKQFGNDDKDLNVLDFGEKIILAFRTVEIIGQLLKNHAYKLDAGPKQEMFTKATNLSMRGLNALVDHFLDPDQLVEFIQSEDSASLENEEEAKEIIFSLAHLIITCFIKATANFTGAEMLRKTYEKSLESNNSKALRFINLSIGLDNYQEPPLAELKRIANDCKTDFLATSALRSIVQGWLRMRPMQDIQKKQMICDTVGISMKKQRQIENRKIRSKAN